MRSASSPTSSAALINNTEAVFSTTAARDTEIREIFQALPTFLDESKLTLNRLAEFSTDTNPLVTQLQPVARQLSGTFLALQRLSPELERFFNGLRPVIKRAEPGFSSLRTILDDQLPPFLGSLDPYFDQLIPVVDTVDRYKAEVTAFLANVSSALNGESIPGGGRRSRSSSCAPPGRSAPGVLASPPSPYKTSRLNSYVKAGGYTKLAQGLDSFYHRQLRRRPLGDDQPGRPHQRPLRPRPDLRDGRRSGSPRPTPSRLRRARQQGDPGVDRRPAEPGHQLPARQPGAVGSQG